VTSRTEELQDAVAEVDRQATRSSQFTQAVLQRAFRRINSTEELLLRVVAALDAQGVVSAPALGLAEDDHEPDPIEDLDETPTIAWPTIALREDGPDERLPESTKIVDCAARMHVCQAVCCKLRFPLSADEVDAGKVRWDLGHPYFVRHDASGRCVHNDAGNGGCSVYEDRPSVCRRYSCAGDTRIWKDFDAMELNDEWISQHLGARNIGVESVVPPMEVRVQLMRKPRATGDGG
jgi:Fe-S-cluster containining protein